MAKEERIIRGRLQKLAEKMKELGYYDAKNVVLVHRSCHQQMQAK